MSDKPFNRFSKENRIPKDVVKLSGEAITRDGVKSRTAYFDFLNLDLDDYSDISFTAEQAKRVANHLRKLSTGSSAIIPLYCAGEQCQPTGSLIKTSHHGDIPIEELDPTKHKLVMYDLCNHHFRSNTRSSYSFSIDSRDYQGVLHRFDTEEQSYSCTPEHLCLVKWNENALNKFVVYLMEKDGCFRIGKTALLVEDKVNKRRFGPSTRARAEKADRLWILDVYSSNTEALLAEEFFSVKWGIPKALFLSTNHKHQIKCKGMYRVTQQQLDQHHQSLKIGIDNVSLLLSKVGLSIKYPIWTSDKAQCVCIKIHGRQKQFSQLGGNNILILHACNVISDVMDMPIYIKNNKGQRLNKNNNKTKTTGSVPLWKPVTKTIIDYQGKVYSLDVEKYHTYITDSIATHNCPFSHSCPLQKIGKAPVGLRCLIETELMKEFVFRTIEEYEIDPANFTEVGFANELAEIEILLMRLNQNLAKPENAELVIDQTVGIGQDGTPIIQKQLSPFMEQKEKLYARRAKIIKLMVGDRQEKYKKEAALKVKIDQDPSSRMAAMRSKLDKLDATMKTIPSVKDEGVLSPQDIIDAEED